MSDVPVSAWWLAAFVPALRTGTGLAALAGIATSLAVLTRPNLAPLAVIVALPYVVRWLRHRSLAHSVDLGIFALTAAIGPAIVAWLFNYWYGSPFLSGYGSERFALLVVVRRRQTWRDTRAGSSNHRRR